MLATHAVGALLFFSAWKGWAFSNGFLQLRFGPIQVIAAACKFLVLSDLCVWLSSRGASSHASPTAAPLSTVLKALNLCIASTAVTVMSLLNFSLAALLCVILVLPLMLLMANPTDSRYARDVKHTLLVTHAMFVLSYFVNSTSLWDWSVLGVWFAPFISLVCVPLLLQAAVVCVPL
ncbi:hypothetical protein M0805_008455 [Coniferiporia weirii]|nr:hypothetical protein M0805_008455 [Coniferiporia weirii]